MNPYHDRADPDPGSVFSEEYAFRALGESVPDLTDSSESSPPDAETPPAEGHAGAAEGDPDPYEDRLALFEASVLETFADDQPPTETSEDSDASHRDRTGEKRDEGQPSQVEGRFTRRIGRREFLTGGLVVGASSLLVPGVQALLGLDRLVPDLVPGLPSLPDLFPGQQRQAPSGKPSLTRWVRRREDFLSLRFDFYNLGLDNSGQKLVRLAAGQPMFVVVTFPPQHVLEEAFLVTGIPGDEKIEGLKPPPVNARLGASSRLAFVVPPFVTEIPFTTEGLLTWTEFAASVVPAASVQGEVLNPELRAPGPKETAIEVPWWLVLSPSEVSSWDHRKTPLTSQGGRTELWHTRLARSTEKFVPGEPPKNERRVRAVWGRDPEFASYYKKLEANRTTAPAVKTHFAEDPNNPLPFRASLTGTNRASIVLNSADWRQSGHAPTPMDVRALSLSALGAGIDLAGEWRDDEGKRHPKVDLVKWLHRGALGRDNYVRVEELGHLFPFGHLAVKITITERAPFQNPGQPQRPTAYLFQRIFYVVLEREKTYPAPNEPASFRQPHDARTLPFRRIRSLTKVTPSLSPQPFETHEVPHLGGTPFLFDFVGVDRSDTDVPFSSPIVFVGVSVARDPQAMQSLRIAYDNLSAGHAFRPRVPLGSRIALAEPDKPGDTTVEADTILFAADSMSGPINPDVGASIKADLDDAGLPAFWPAMWELEARVPAAERVATGAPGVRRLEWSLAYVVHEFDTTSKDRNPGEVFAQIVDPAPLAFGDDGRAGAIVNPDFTPDGLSRTHGPVADVANVTKGDFVPDNFFPDAEKAVLLGNVSLKHVIKPSGIDFAPKLLQREEGGEPGAPDRIITDLTWSPELTSSGLLQTDDGSLTIQARYVTEVKNQTTTSEIVGDLQNVALAFPSTGTIMKIDLKRLRFTSTNGAKPDLRVDVGEVTFLESLSFLNELRKYLGPVLKLAGEQAGGPSVNVTPDGITSSYTLPVPSVEIGVLLIQNLTVNAGLLVPFGAKPARASYYFSTRENPFLVTVSAIGGGGFLGFRVGAKEIEAVEGSLEFGGATALNLGVAKGKAHVLAGVYYKVSDKGGLVLAGTFRVGGSVRVLGLVTVSAQFNLKLQWEPSTEKLEGSASIEVEIDVGFFSKSITLGPVRRTFGSNGADPSFGQLYEQGDWTRYCNAFAEV